MKNLIFPLLLSLCLLCSVFLQPSTSPVYCLCANSGESCGTTPHTLWLKYEDVNVYTIACDEPGHDEDCKIEITEVPLYRMCTKCHYSFYLFHVEVSRKHIVQK
jgi:hypothetical protein